MMDPNQTLASLRELVDMADGARALGSATGYRFAELFAALDGWLSKGGFLPQDWAEAQEADKRALRAALNRPRYTEEDGPKWGG